MKKEKKRKGGRSLGALPFEELTSQWRKQKKKELGYFWFLMTRLLRVSQRIQRPKEEQQLILHTFVFVVYQSFGPKIIRKARMSKMEEEREREREVVESIAYGA